VHCPARSFPPSLQGLGRFISFFRVWWAFVSSGLDSTALIHASRFLPPPRWSGRSPLFLKPNSWNQNAGGFRLSSRLAAGHFPNRPAPRFFPSWKESPRKIASAPWRYMSPFSIDALRALPFPPQISCPLSQARGLPPFAKQFFLWRLF